jgi:ABC-type transport system involved in Fe-S cluster assembly fused permease/ATPase subunit
MYLGKWFNVQVPFILQNAIDTLSKSQKLGSMPTVTTSATASLLFYGISKALSTVFAEVKTCLFAHVSFNALRKFANQIFQHLHELDTEFHLKTPSGTISVAYVRAIRGFQTLMFQIVFSVIPAALELFLVSRILHKKCGPMFSTITLTTFTLYLLFTVWITQRRVKLRQELVDVDNARNAYFIDSILNHEVVKYFTSEEKESKKFDSYLFKIQKLNIDSTYAIALLNLGQTTMFCTGLTISLLIALKRVQTGLMSVGDLVAVNSMLLQLSIPFNFMGYTCKFYMYKLLVYFYCVNLYSYHPFQKK